MNALDQNGFSMNIAELTVEMNRFVEKMGWYAPDSPKPQTAENLAKSLVLEAVEVLEHFQWDPSEVDTGEVGAELADVFLYTLQLASVLSIDLETVTLSKLNLNYGRDW
jgi:NTP pyrophosphatase (non-canonical NTP hydrolase)